MSSLSVVDGATLRESFFLGFYDESTPSNGSYASHISVPTALARSVVPIGIPATPTEQEATLDAVAMAPAILHQIVSMAKYHPLLLNISMQVDALISKTDLDDSTPQALNPLKVGNKDKSGSSL